MEKYTMYTLNQLSFYRTVIVLVCGSDLEVLSPSLKFVDMYVVVAMYERFSWHLVDGLNESKCSVLLGTL